MENIHKFKKRINATLKRLEDSENITPKNKELILEYKRTCEKEDLSDARVLFYLKHLIQIGKWLEMDFDKATRKDVEDLVIFIRAKEDYAPETKRGFKICIKRLFEWLGKEEYFLKQNGKKGEKWLTTTLKHKDKKQPEEILSKEEIRNIIGATTNARDKALVSLLYESGARMGEFLALKIKHISWEKFGAKLSIPEGKTGARKIPIIESVGYLKSWLDNHCDHNNPEAWLWVSVSNNGSNGNRLDYNTIRFMLRRCGVRAGLGEMEVRESQGEKKTSYEVYEGKDVNPHAFRHARATHLTKKGMNEIMMCKFFGWAQGSKMPSHYSHISANDLEDKLCDIYGLSKKEDKDRDEIVCSRCRKANESSAEFCNCGMPLSLESAVEHEAQREDYDSVLSKAIAKAEHRPEAKELLKSLIKEVLMEQKKE